MNELDEAARDDNDLLTLLGIAAQNPDPTLRRVNALFETTPNMIWVSGKRKNRLASNSRYLRYVLGPGKDVNVDKYDAITGNEWEQRVHPDDLREFMRGYMRAFDARESFSYEIRLRRFDGEYRWVFVQGNPYIDPVSGRFFGYIGNCHDVHERHTLAVREHEAHLELASMNSDLQEALTAKSRFLAVMSHEIRTPLAVVISAMELMKGSQETAERAELLESVEENIKHLKVLLNDVIDVARIDQYGVTLTLSEFNVNVTARDCVRILHPECVKKGCEIVFETDVQNGDCYVRGDEGRYRQILINLLSNAVKYTPPGEKIILDLHKALPDDTTLIPRYVIRVIDHGPGIPENQREKLFQSFTQLGSVIMRGQEGVGLGLYITERIVRAFGGSVAYEPVSPHGSIFRVELPLPVAHGLAALPPRASAPSSSASAPTNTSSTASDAANLRVLVAEDNKMLQMMVRKLLDRNGVTRCDAAYNGVEAVEKARNQPYDLIIMDIQMPVKDGFAATREIREMPNHRDTTIVRFTASTIREDHDQCRALGMEEYCLPKPVRESDVRAMIGNVIKKLNASRHA